MPPVAWAKLFIPSVMRVVLAINYWFYYYVDPGPFNWMIQAFATHSALPNARYASSIDSAGARGRLKHMNYAHACLRIWINNPHLHYGYLEKEKVIRGTNDIAALSTNKLTAKHLWEREIYWVGGRCRHACALDAVNIQCITPHRCESSDGDKCI